jgi:transposase-like protein
LGLTPFLFGLWQGSSENATVVRELLKDLIERGLDVNRSILVVLDGGKGLHRGVKEVFGERALIQRCRVHKLRNVLEHLSEPHRRQAAMRLRAAWSQPSEKEARAELEATVRWLEAINPSAARSLQEGLEETLTLQRLGLAEELQRSLSSTNLIESALARTGAFTQRVKRWRGGKMRQRWCATALLEAEKGFRRIRGHQHLAQLSAALNPALDTITQAA